MNTTRMEKFAELAVRVGLDLQKGQCLQIGTGPETYEYARAIARQAYIAGAKYVRIAIADNEVARYRVDNSSLDDLAYVPSDVVAGAQMQIDEDWARIRIDNTEDIDALKGADSEKVSTMSRAARSAIKFLSEQLMRDKHPWLVLAVPGPKWASKIYGLDANASDAEVQAALEKFEDVWSSIMRLDNDDPVAVWRKHGKTLAERGEALNALELDRVRFQSPGTDLTIGLAPTHSWKGGPGQLPDGRWFEPNLPTEEVFTTPDRLRTEGRVAVVKPVKVMETLVEGAWFRFEGGKVVEYGADQGEQILEKFLATDANSGFLGEVALVDVDSPINRSGLIFGSILFDENASCHIALGAGYPSCLTNAEDLKTSEDLMAAGCNDSVVHTDFMIGTDETTVTGYTRDGKEFPIIVNGKFAI